MQRDMQRQEGRLTVEALRNCVDVSFIVIRAQQHGNMTCIPEKEEERERELQESWSKQAKLRLIEI